MSSPLEKFILENRSSFDEDAPDPRVWEKINEKMNPEIEKVKPMRSLPFKRWLTAAAAVVLLTATGVLYYSLHSNKPVDALAGIKQKPDVPGNHLPIATVPVDTLSNLISNPDTHSDKSKQNNQNQESSITGENKSPETGENKEMYYYAKLIEIKHEELKTLEKDEPLLYRQFAGDVQKLDSVYHSLKTQLPNNSNRELVIEAMISNLQLQIGLLNRQLNIIKQIKHSKKSAYEKAYKSL